ncbi:hypothetical protein SHELI_v1c01090 [Spiroplasma helicoides]|uniref:Uncharacterized protein n=1 Tax=Spiroplasma helicoides TaxID=216938 RepID=A0A1B3SJF0_9MOLU|nr:hypothetical protein [Spiroplasma helicoides]AOG60064.1 hypothetical protein SHELI_v1c01090 [Spiroplasma helicoides]
METNNKELDVKLSKKARKLQKDFVLAENLEQVRSHKVNTSVIYGINLKMAFRNPGVLVGFFIHLILTMSLIVVEVNNGILTQDINKLGLYKTLIYAMGTISTVFAVLLHLLFLFKKQKKSGIHAIELRAGLVSWKSYAIRCSVSFTISMVATIILFIFGAIYQQMTNPPAALYASFVYSQIFFLGFLSIIILLIMLPILIFSSTMVGTLFATVVMFVFTLTPVFSSLKFKFTGSMKAPDDYSLKLSLLNEFYNNLKDTNNGKEIFGDEANSNGESTTLKQLESNIQKMSQNSSDTMENLRLDFSNNRLFGNYGSQQLPLTESDFASGKTKWNFYNSETRQFSTNFNNIISSTMLYNSLNIGQSNYDWSYIVGKPKSIFENTTIQKVLDAIYNAVDTHKNQFSADNSSKLSPLFYTQYTQYNYQSEPTSNVMIENFTNKLIDLLPEYSSLISNIRDIYSKYYPIFIASEAKILGNQSPYLLDNRTASKFKSKNHFYTSQLKTTGYMEGGYSSSIGLTIDYKDLVSGGAFETDNPDWGKTGLADLTEEQQAIYDKNIEVADMYYKHPELTILNWFIINCWYEVFTLNLSSPDDLYNYYNQAKAGSGLTTDISRHFGVMSSGIFTNPSINDSYNSSMTSGIYQGQTVSVSNILDYEKYLPTYNKSYTPLRPILEAGSIKYKQAFIIPLAFAIYLLIAAPLSYLGYLAYNKKIKV